VKAIRREYEETGLRVEIGSLLGVLDRRDKDSITLLFAAVPNKSSIKVKQNNREIEKADFQASLPKKASPSAKYFWSARRGPVKKTPQKFELQLTSSRRSSELRRPLLLSNSKGALATLGTAAQSPALARCFDNSFVHSVKSANLGDPLLLDQYPIQQPESFHPWYRAATDFRSEAHGEFSFKSDLPVG
jgi:hypothetical protein